jgi:hypothetical protein
LFRESVAIHNSRVSSSTDSTISTGRFFFNQVAPEDVTVPQALALRSAPIAACWPRQSSGSPGSTANP